jgi:hypothetical protein
MSVRKFVLFAGAVAVIVGLILLFTPVGAYDDGMSLACGSAASSNIQGAENQEASTEMNRVNYAAASGVIYTPPSGGTAAIVCDSNLTTRRIWSWLVLAIGLLAAASAVVVRSRRESPAPVA